MTAENDAAGSGPAGDPAQDGNEPAEAEDRVYLRQPRDGIPQPLTDPDQLAQAAAGLAAGFGPVAVDAERASGYRYSQRAYLVQLRRAGYPTVLIDPIRLPDLSSIDAALADAQWILHAASQDLACLAELGMRPRTLFDTELAGRLLGSERVALGTMIEQYLSVLLEKGHSAADWSTRPLPTDWLAYAALDVELLIELRQVLIDQLSAAGKLDWALQEFETIRTAPTPAPRVDPWRRTSGIHSLRKPRQLAMVRSLWFARDQLAADRDVAPGRILPDAAILAAVRANPQRAEELAALPVFMGPRQRRLASYWYTALRTGEQCPDEELPPVSQLADDPDAMPSAARWPERDLPAATRLAGCRRIVAELAETHQVPAQNVIAGEVVRRLCWRLVQPPTEVAVRERLAELGARPWQIDLCAPPFATVFTTPVDPVPSERPTGEHAEPPQPV